MATTTSDIAIIGFGYSGLMVLANLVRKLNAPASILIFDAAPHAPKGTAYSTPRPEHLLNVRAENMGAFADDPNGFDAWLNGDGKNATATLGINEKISSRDFSPRILYGRYLENIWADTQKLAAEKNIIINHVKENVALLDKENSAYKITTDSKQQFTATHLVVTSGITFSSDVLQDPKYITNVWHYDFNKLPATSFPVVIIGTGLTAVDVCLSIIKAGWPHPILALSRNALLPLPHSNSVLNYTIEPQALAPLKTLSQMFRFLKLEWRKTAKNIPWQVVVDGLRPHLNQLWQQLSAKDQKRFLKQYFTRWNVIRHRMPAEVAEKLYARNTAGKFSLAKGALEGAEVKGDMVEIRCTIAGESHVMGASLVFDCRGPQYRNLPAFLAPLEAKGVVQKHPTGFGLAAHSNHIAGDQIYAMGSLLMGSALETTAVPDLREQAARIAEHLSRIMNGLDIQTSSAINAHL